MHKQFSRLSIAALLLTGVCLSFGHAVSYEKSKVENVTEIKYAPVASLEFVAVEFSPVAAELLPAVLVNASYETAATSAIATELAPASVERIRVLQPDRKKGWVQKDEDLPDINTAAITYIKRE